ncbi:hypothetical protein BVC80_41g49 [Macleaya cordata]|uniref:F-box domain-containing protein n=1 Tax=Macleaya cordata TaxID=56857 RepID=A0A200QMP8_MACCD|nr:hypothetical protein BVC80_41g49 [Macleaya cordata]
MDRLPPSLQLEILNRLNESTDLARCRLVSKTLDNLSYDVSSLNIICSHDRYLKSRSPETQSHITPFKSIAWREISMIDNLEADDLFFMDDDFVSEWLPEIGGRLKSISIANFQIQARRSDRASKILNLISFHYYFIWQV